MMSVMHARHLLLQQAMFLIHSVTLSDSCMTCSLQRFANLSLFLGPEIVGCIEMR